MKNIHFIGEWFDCHAAKSLLADPQATQTCCLEHTARRHLPIRYAYFTITAANGVIGAMTGDGIHIVLRTFSHRHAVIADLFVDQGESTTIRTPMRVLDGLRDEFRPMRALLHRVGGDGQSLPVHGRTPRTPTEVFLIKPAQHAI